MFTLAKIDNLSEDKTVNRGSLPSNRASNYIGVIVDGDRDGKITSTPIDPGDATNSLVECAACYISTRANVNMWIRIDLADNYFVTKINVFTGELLLSYHV